MHHLCWHFNLCKGSFMAGTFCTIRHWWASLFSQAEPFTGSKCIAQAGSRGWQDEGALGSQHKNLIFYYFSLFYCTGQAFNPVVQETCWDTCAMERFYRVLWPFTVANVKVGQYHALRGATQVLSHLNTALGKMLTISVGHFWQSECQAPGWSTFLLLQKLAAVWLSKDMVEPRRGTLGGEGEKNTATMHPSKAGLPSDLPRLVGANETLSPPLLLKSLL